MTHIEHSPGYAAQDYAVFCAGVDASKANRLRKPPARYKGEERALWLAGYDADKYERRLLTKHGYSAEARA